ncbi:hypothetical protein KAT51_03625 [bacterium]|nr:hypothetical protein [bacterium]
MKPNWRLPKNGTFCLSSFSEERIFHKTLLYFTKTGEVTSVGFARSSTQDYYTGFQKNRRKLELRKVGDPETIIKKSKWFLHSDGSFRLYTLSEDREYYGIFLYYMKGGKVKSVGFSHVQTQDYYNAFQKNRRILEPEKVHAEDRKMNARRRGLGLEFEPLNEWFPGAEGHHINTKQIIYIPKELHKSVWHNITSGKNMEEINKLAFEWLDHELIRKSFEALEGGKSQPVKRFGKPREEIMLELN